MLQLDPDKQSNVVLIVDLNNVFSNQIPFERVYTFAFLKCYANFKRYGKDSYT